MNDDLIDLAQETQRKHADLIARAAKLTSNQDRLDVRNDLDALRADFTVRALSLTNTEAPYLWMAENPDQAVAIAVRADLADTESRLAALAEGEAFQKVINSNLGNGVKINIPSGMGPALAIGAVGVILILVAILVVRR